MSLKNAITALTTTYNSLDLVAQGLKVDAKEVAELLYKTTHDTAEFVALTCLAKYNPYVVTDKEDVLQIEKKQDIPTTG
jgi:hypothetical protein